MYESTNRFVVPGLAPSSYVTFTFYSFSRQFCQKRLTARQGGAPGHLQTYVGHICLFLGLLM